MRAFVLNFDNFITTKKCVKNKQQFVFVYMRYPILVYEVIQKSRNPHNEMLFLVGFIQIVIKSF